MNPSTLSPIAMQKAKEIAYRQLAERCKVDLFFLNKYILNCDIEDEFVHGALCAATRPILYWKDKEYAKKFEFPSDYGRTEEQGLPNEAEKAEFYERVKAFIPGDDGELDKPFSTDLHQLLALVPRGTLKTTVITIGFVLQYFLVHPENRVLIDSETSTNSSGFLGEIKGHLEGNDAYREIFRACHGVYPDARAKDKSTRWTNSAIDLACRTKPRKEASIDTGGVDTTKNSRHYDLIIFDDLHSEINTQTKEQIEKVKTHWKLAYSLLDPGCPVIVIGTRWDFNDLYQMIIDEHKHNFNIFARCAESPEGELLYPAKLDRAFLQGKRELQGSYIYSCNPGEAPILMADYSIKRIDEIKVGDEIIGFETATGSAKNKLVKTKVTQVNHRSALVQKMYLASGNIVRCTPDHKWYTGRSDETHLPYRPAKVGSALLQVVDTCTKPTSQEKIDFAYLAGMIDGEGACKYGNIAIHQSPTHNPHVFARIRLTLDKLRLPYKENQECFVVNGGRQSKFDILRFGNPAKKQQIVDALWDNPGMPARKKDKVVEIIPDGIDEVYALTTESGNYVVWGYMSKNCQYMNEPVDAETAKFKRDYFQYRNWNEVEGIPINWYLTVDPGGDGASSDFAALVLSGMDYQDNLYVRYIQKGKMTEGQIVMATITIFRKFQPRRIAVETLAGAGKSIIYAYKTKMKELGIWLPIQYIEHRATAKNTRIEALAPKYEFGHIFHIRECPQIKELEDELLKFPKAKNDDVSDAFATVLEIATPPMRNQVQQSRVTERKKLFKKLNAPRSPMMGY